MPELIPDKTTESLYERMLQDCLKGELRIVNAGLPRSQKRLSDLLDEKYPHVVCNDGTSHSFKKRELQYLASIIDANEQQELLLPILIELGTEQSEASIICQAKVEERVVSATLGMPVTCQDGRIRIHKPQLALLRRKLKTTTVYVFSPRIVA